MLDHFAVFTKGGVVLFATQDERPLVGNPINGLIASVLLEERTGERSWSEGPYVLKWTFANDYDLIFVAVHQKVLQLLYVDELLESVKKTFCELVNPSGLPNTRQLDYSKFNGAAFAPAFQKLHDSVEAQHMTRKAAPKAMRTFEQTDKGKEMAKAGKLKKRSAKKKKTVGKDSAGTDEDEEGEEGEEDDEMAEDLSTSGGEPQGTPSQPPAAAYTPTQELEEGEILPSPAKPVAPTVEPRSPLEEGEIREDDAEERRKEALARLAAKGVRAKGQAAPKAKPKPAAAKEAGGKKPKVARKGDAVSKEELESLDVAKALGKAPAVVTEEMRRQFMGEKPLNLDAPVDGQEEEESEDMPKKGFFSSIISNWTNRTLKREDVDPILEKFRDHLIAKNVAAEIADKLRESIATSMVGTTMSSFKSVNAALKAALKDSLTRILTPKKSVNILLDIETLRKSARVRPYTIVFVGVNGVGKSTSLSKVCFWLQQNGLKVMIAACDTFRSGAVEQLRVHSQCLNAHLYEKGYGKDAAEVARDAIAFAKDNRYDVVLIDTAGRMEGNEPLMRALAKLINVNQPDLILFVGEALVGNKAVEQLTRFNQALIDHASEMQQPRTIDGIFLTKFDTIDDKVGAALSMVYTTGQPIVFLGVGQHYHSVRAFSVDHVLPPLLKVL